MTFTATEENYIKAIYHLQSVHEKVSTSLLSEEMQTKPASVTDMLKKLELKKTVHYQKYKGFILTELGNKKAISVVRKHRLWEYFLVNKLGFEWDQVHSMAEELEHISNNELTTRLDNYLGNPAFDPHGDPIPDNKGKMKILKQENLANVPLKKLLFVSSVKNQSPEMLELLNHYHIGIGTCIQVNRRFEFDGSIEIKIDKQPVTIVSNQVALNVFCTI
ncbi:MAG TPA: metal-dependent transcriptional regulator [Ferruginibacter sp.]|nr:metal-dependent transcriptional regulator [Ferruginibacter sp.]